MNEGGLVPFELTVQILINGLLANPSKVTLIYIIFLNFALPLIYCNGYLLF